MNYRLTRKAKLLTIALALVVLLGPLWYLTRVDLKDLRPDRCIIFLDRQSRVLRFVPDPMGLRHRWVDLSEMPEILVKAFIAGEDERFLSHMGFDLVAILRALRDNLRQGRIVSGASTITQQLCRLAYPRKRTYMAKFLEILRSIRIELMLTKEQILQYYLNRVPMGNNITGVGLASEVYFGKSVKDLTVAEAATLAALPKAPEKYNPYGPNRALLKKRRNWILKRMRALGFISEPQYQQALREALSIRAYRFAFNAPHLVELLMKRLTEERLPEEVFTTIDLTIQKEVERVLLSHKQRLSYRGARQVAALVVHNPTMGVLAMVGSISYGPENRGYVNGTTALRSAGSTLKPFLYALAIENGFLPTHILSDTTMVLPSPSGDYVPVNYDRRQYGPVMMRTALGSSLNLSAVKMLNSLGLDRFYEFLKDIHLINYPERGPEYYGLGLAIGNPEVSLEELVGAYAMLANRGVYRPLRYLLHEPPAQGTRIISPATAYIITDMLSDPAARGLTFGNTESLNYPFKVALKTGTSTRYRDCWIVAYTPEYTIGIWVGNFEGDPTWGLSGASGAAPILKDILGILYRKGTPSDFVAPEDVLEKEVCAISGMRPGPYCRYIKKEFFIKGTEPDRVCTFHTPQRAYHLLPSVYASWLYEKASSGTEGGYRLKGFPADLARVFIHRPEDELPSEGPSVRVRGGRVVGFRESSRRGSPLVQRAHYRIGSPPELSPPLQASEVSYVKILYPLNGDRFVYEGDRNEMIRLEAITTGPVKYVIWFVDGRELTRTGPPYQTYWKPTPGVHTITVTTPQQTGDTVEIVVE